MENYRRGDRICIFGEFEVSLSAFAVLNNFIQDFLEGHTPPELSPECFTRRDHS
jgi:hypothetical protein